MRNSGNLRHHAAGLNPDFNAHGLIRKTVNVGSLAGLTIEYDPRPVPELESGGETCSRRC